uniref:PGG domain-containing protein n=1 Tax=Kalanchoe fedtschenkoi TaxID=63787 RepID=A0A7N0TFH9_KALFE
MEEATLFRAARTGNIAELHKLMHQNPLILHTAALTSATNPLHVASLSGHVDFVRELILLHPEFVRELNQEGLSPLHLASAGGHLAVVKELLKVDGSLCRLKGRDNKTPLHAAAIKGRVGVINEMRSCCETCVEDVTLQGESALHLAVKHWQVEAFEALLRWVGESKLDQVVNMRDEQGNTVLHLATYKKNRQVIEMLLVPTSPTYSSVLEVNAVNKRNLTSLDLLLMFPSEAGDREIGDILTSASAATRSATQMTTHLGSPNTSRTCQMQKQKNLLNYFKFQRDRDNPSDARNALLVIAVLVATATYQVGLSPPGGIWQDNNSGRNFAGQSIIGTRSRVLFIVFVVFNSIGFSLSMQMITVLTSKFPMRGQIQVCLLAVYFTYNVAVTIIAPGGSKTFIIVFTSVLPSLITFVTQFMRPAFKYVKKMAKATITRA